MHTDTPALSRVRVAVRRWLLVHAGFTGVSQQCIRERESGGRAGLVHVYTGQQAGPVRGPMLPVQFSLSCRVLSRRATHPPT